LKIHVGLLLWLLSFFWLSAEDIWVIEKINIEIDGSTKESAFRNFLDIKEGSQFESEEDFLINLDKTINHINNNRLFEEGTDVSWIKLEKTDHTQPVEVSIYVKDSWNIILLPYPKYDSNTGFEIKLKGKHYNFLGYMKELSFDLDYSSDDNSILFALEVPVNKFEFKLNYEVFNNSASVEEIDLINEFYLATSYGYPFTFRNHGFDFSITEGLFILPQDENDKSYFNTEAALSSSWTLPWSIYDNHQISYHPRLSFKFNYLPHFEYPISDKRDGVDFKFTHSLNLGEALWKDNNYRDGEEYSLGNWVNYHLESDMPLEERFSGKLWTAYELHKDWYPLGASFRLFGQYDIFSRSDYGSYMRGILDSKMWGKSAIVLNSAFYLTVWNWDPVWEWYGGPTIDVAYLNDVDYDGNGSMDSNGSIIYSAGVEGLAFPYKMRSIYARLSLGFDLQAVMDAESSSVSVLTDNMEIFFGLGSFF